MKSITFLLPSGAGNPIGGLKIVFEYANRFVTDGYDVHIMIPMSLCVIEAGIIEKTKVIPRYIYNYFSKKYLPYNWFDLDRRVKIKLVLSLDEVFAPKTDIYIATAIQTSEYLSKYRKIEPKNKYYFIQHFEDWSVSPERVLASYRLPLNKIVIAKWLKDIVTHENSDASIVENGFDFNQFSLTTSYENKDRYSVCMLYHSLEIKGCADGIKALNIVKEQYPQLSAYLFGVPERPIDLPLWIKYKQKPSKEELNNLYNNSSIFIATSHSEGWGLTLGEAMMCGAAVACTDCGGYAEMAYHNKTALISNVKDPKAMSENIIKLIEDNELRYRIAKSGYENIQKFTMELAYSKFKAIIEKSF